MIEITYNSESVYRPIFIKSDSSVSEVIQISVYNSGSGLRKSVGLYLEPGKNLGALSKLPDRGPYIDYDDLIRWGNEAESGSTYGGLVVIDSANVEKRFSRKNGSKKANKIVIGDMLPGSSKTVSLRLEVPSGVSSRRLYVSLVAE